MEVVFRLDPKFVGDVQQAAVDGLNRLGFYLQGEVRKTLNVGQPRRRSGLRFRGLDPSRPGEPPRKVTAQLQRSIAFAVDASNMTLTLGSSIGRPRYPLFLERSTSKMAARPYFRPTLNAQTPATLTRVFVGEGR